MKLKVWAATLFVMVCTSLSSFAEDKHQISRETFMTFAKVSGLEKQYTQMVTDVLDRVKNGIVATFNMKINQENIPAELKEKLYPIFRESAENIKTRLEDLFNREITFDDLVTNVYLPIYRKHFTESELKELIGFYGSPIGIKVSRLVNVLMQERAEMFNAVYDNKLQAMGRDIIDKEMERIRTKLKELKPDNKSITPGNI